MSETPISKDKVSLVFCVCIDGQHYYVKQYHSSRGIRSWLGLSRIRQEARNQLWFSRTGLSAAQVVAYGEEYILSRTFRGVLITASIDGTRDLAWMATNQPDLFKNRPWANQVISQVAEIPRTLHQHRFCHNDLKWSSLLVSQQLESPKVSLIDCPVGQRFLGPFFDSRIIKDLACLDKVGRRALSRTQRLRFYKQYRQSKVFSEKDREIMTKVLVYFKGRD